MLFLSFKLLGKQKVKELLKPIHVKLKAIPFSEKNPEKDKYPELTQKMIDSLLEALEKQKKKIPFGPVNMRGSLTPLIAKGLIIRKKTTLNGCEDVYWQVADEAIVLLTNLGLDV